MRPLIREELLEKPAFRLLSVLAVVAGVMLIGFTISSVVEEQVLVASDETTTTTEPDRTTSTIGPDATFGTTTKPFIPSTTSSTSTTLPPAVVEVLRREMLIFLAWAELGAGTYAEIDLAVEVVRDAGEGADNQALAAGCATLFRNASATGESTWRGVLASVNDGELATLNIAYADQLVKAAEVCVNQPWTITSTFLASAKSTRLRIDKRLTDINASANTLGLGDQWPPGLAPL